MNKPKIYVILNDEEDSVYLFQACLTEDEFEDIKDDIYSIFNESLEVQENIYDDEQKFDSFAEEGKDTYDIIDDYMDRYMETKVSELLTTKYNFDLGKIKFKSLAPDIGGVY